MYATYSDLKMAYSANEVGFEEFRKYFSRLLGTNNPGYPDFTQDKMAEITGMTEAAGTACEEYKREHPEKRKVAKKYRTCVVVGETDGMNDIKAIRNVFVFNTRAKAMSFVRGIADGRHGAYQSAGIMHADGLTYFVVKEGDSDDYAKANFS